MADINKVLRLVNGVPRGVSTKTNSMVVNSLKVGIGEAELTEDLVNKISSINGFIKVFAEVDWVLNIDNDYELLILQSEHLLGTTPSVIVEELEGSDYVQVETVVKNNSGDIRILINSDLRFVGRELVKY